MLTSGAGYNQRDQDEWHITPFTRRSNRPSRPSEEAHDESGMWPNVAAMIDQLEHAQGGMVRFNCFQSSLVVA
jgi:hypothetical protein